MLHWTFNGFRTYPEDEFRALVASILLSHLLLNITFRDRFVDSEGARLLCSDMIRSRNFELQYNIIFAVWILSFDERIARSMQVDYGIISILMEILKASVKEKIFRVTVAALRNFLSHCYDLVLPIFIGGKLLNFLENIDEKKILDEETISDVDFLKENLNSAYQRLNSFEEYVAEVKSGLLTWSPPHKSDMFWRENAPRLAENDCEILKILSQLLETSTDFTTVAIAANDLGMYVANHIMGRRNLEVLGIKAKMMVLLAHKDPEVRFQALSAMQKFVKNSWLQ